MAISYILGNPGSGKTYYAVYEIYKYFYPNKEQHKELKFKNDKENLSKFDNCYSNINELKTEDFLNVFELDFNTLKFHLTNLYNLKINEDKEDSELIKYCQDNKIYNTLFVIDEIHNYFNKRDDVLVWWLTYHRHLHHELILITQNLALVATEYKTIAEFFYKAVDGGKRLFKNKLRYIRYSDYRMYNNSIVQGGGKSIKLYSFLYNLYHSGAKSKSKSFVKWYIFASLFLFGLFVLSIFYTISLFTEKSKSSNDSFVIENQDFQSVKTSSSFNDNSKSLIILDNNTSYSYFVTCINNSCFINSTNNKYSDVPTSYFFHILSKNEFEYKSKEKTFKNTVKYFIVSNKDIFKNLIIKKGVSTYEKNTNTIDSINASIF